MKFRLRRAIVPLVVLALTASPAFADDVLQLIPQDALGVIVVKNRAATDAKAKQLLATLHADYPTPAAFLELVTGIRDGMKPDGDMLLAILPGNADDTTPKFCVFLPIADYGSMLAAYDLPLAEGVLEVSVDGETLLVARRGDWAILGDASLRDRMQSLVSGELRPPREVADWQNWINENDVALIAFDPGIKAAWLWTTSQSEGSNDDRTGPVAVDRTVRADDVAGSLDIFQPLRRALRTQTSRSPKLMEFVRARSIGVAAHVDEQQNARLKLRIRHRRGLAAPAGLPTDVLPHSLYAGGSFVMNGAGQFPWPLRDLFVDWFARSALNDLKTQQRLVVGKETAARFEEALNDALANVRSIAVLTKPGEKSAGLYTNDLWVIRSASSNSFADDAREVMRLWNTLNRDAQGGEPLIFDVADQKIGDRDATRYSLDIPAPDGLTASDMRQIMEKFFGKSGKMQLWIVPVDDRTSLIAAATKREVVAALQVLDRKQPPVWNDPNLADANKLLPADADWRLFFNPAAHYAWSSRLAEVNGPTLGGPKKKDFASSPAIGIAGSFPSDELTIEAVIPAETVKSAGEYRVPAR